MSWERSIYTQEELRRIAEASLMHEPMAPKAHLKNNSGTSSYGYWQGNHRLIDVKDIYTRDIYEAFMGKRPSVSRHLVRVIVRELREHGGKLRRTAFDHLLRRIETKNYFTEDYPFHEGTSVMFWVSREVVSYNFREMKRMCLIEEEDGMIFLSRKFSDLLLKWAVMWEKEIKPTGNKEYEEFKIPGAKGFKRNNHRPRLQQKLGIYIDKATEIKDTEVKETEKSEENT